MPSAMQTAALSPHPSTTSDVVRYIDARIEWAETDRLSIAYRLRGDCGRIRIPEACRPQRTNGLWRHTCFEAFLLNTVDGYFEFNFAPSGEWAAYAFTRYREAAPLPQVLAPELSVRRYHDTLELDAVINFSPSTVDKAAPLKIALAAVVEDDAGTLSYWALIHPPGKPDFHHRDNFVVDFQSSAMTQASLGK
jgi:hypothetical protein